MRGHLLGNGINEGRYFKTFRVFSMFSNSYCVVHVQFPKMNNLTLLLWVCCKVLSDLLLLSGTGYNGKQFFKKSIIASLF